MAPTNHNKRFTAVLTGDFKFPVSLHPAAFFKSALTVLSLQRGLFWLIAPSAAKVLTLNPKPVTNKQPIKPKIIAIFFTPIQPPSAQY